jgi:glycerophosphoryl diester phosphodiesterase
MRLTLAVFFTSIIVFFAVEVAAVEKGGHPVSQLVAHRGSSIDRPECTMASTKRAIKSGATATEVDVRRTKDGVLVILHDDTLDRTTNGTGPLSEITYAELKILDAGSWFDPKYASQRVPRLSDVLSLCKDRMDILLDLKETDDPAYVHQVVSEVKEFGDPAGTVIGVRSVEHAKTFRQLLPEARQIGLIAGPDHIEEYATAGVETIRLWPRWVDASLGIEDPLVKRVRSTGAALHINGGDGSLESLLPILSFNPDSTSSDAPALAVKWLRKLKRWK